MVGHLFPLAGVAECRCAPGCTPGCAKRATLGVQRQACSVFGCSVFASSKPRLAARSQATVFWLQCSGELESGGGLKRHSAAVCFSEVGSGVAGSCNTPAGCRVTQNHVASLGRRPRGLQAPTSKACPAGATTGACSLRPGDYSYT
eukprot:scaffold45397_cov65-Phaeocystis_antarctica.AAC.3